MSIFDRLARLARAEFNHVKAVIADRDDDAPADVRDERLERLRRAREELERAEAALKRAQIEDGAAAWGAGGDGSRERGGASAWGRGGADAARGSGADAWRAEPEPEVRGAAATTFTQEIRLAYAALELPLGADRDRVQRAYREMLSRYHPDKHAHNPELQHAANELTRRVKEARDVLLAWLG